MRIAAAFLMLGLLVACGAAPPEAATLDTRNDVCGTCRMTVSSAKFAGQVVAPGELPVFFDDIGCLGRYLSEHEALPRGAVAFVADHRTRDWSPLETAVITRALAVETPMGSHLIAHATSSSRDADAASRGGTDVPRAQVSGRLLREGTR